MNFTQALERYHAVFGEDPYQNNMGFLRSIYTYATDLVPGGGRVVEIGTNYGRSAFFWMCGLHGKRASFTTIDPVFITGTVNVPDAHHPEGHNYTADLATVQSRLIASQSDATLEIIPGYSNHVLNSWERPIDLLFCDGEHTREAVARDCEWLRWVKPGGYAAFDDWIHDVKESVRSYLSNNPGWSTLYESTAGPGPDGWAITLLQKDSNA